MAQRYKQEILDEIPEVDGILGTSTYDEISNVLKKVLGGSRESCFHDLNALPNVEVPRVVTTGGYYAFLKIAEGCDKALHLLYYSGFTRQLPQCSDGASDRGGETAGFPGCKRADPGGSGDYLIRY